MMRAGKPGLLLVDAGSKEWLDSKASIRNIPPMKFIADLHIHSHFSRATARNLVPRDLSLWAQKKGVAVVGTGDFTHAGWISELRQDLVEAEAGLYRLNPGLQEQVEKELPESCRFPTRFLLSGEISCIYKRGGKTRKVHNLILMPDFDAVTRLNDRLGRIGNLKSDGRPILGLDSRDLLEIVLDVCDRAFFIPAHIWTPWFSLFGSKSGFDAIEECFDDLTPHIHALETGLSSDPPMNRLLSALDGYLLVSNSDAHSPAKLGREANLFETPLDYDRIREAMITREGFEGTIEFFPEEGKYHYDGHRKCGICLHPRETAEAGGICPECGKPMTLGVLHRIEALADRTEPRLSKPFYSLIPLPEILSEIIGTGPATKKVLSAYEDLLTALGPELRILMDSPLRDIERAGGMLLAQAVDRMRETRVIRQEGYDGEYGVIRLFQDREIEALRGQMALFAAPAGPARAEKNRPTPRTRPAEKRATTTDGAEKAILDPLLDPLNPEQKEAVFHQRGHLLIVAGPGTGKTMTLTHRIAHLIRSGHAAPKEILALTFTNKAAGEMRERLSNLLAGENPDRVRVATFHGFCLEVLRREGERLNLPPGFTLCSETDALLLARRVVAETGKGGKAAARFLKELPRRKRLALSKENQVLSDPDLLPLFETYQEKLRALGMLDLNDLEVETLRLFQDHPAVAHKYSNLFPWIFVDEYQDTNPVQSALLRSLVYPEPDAPCTSTLCAIGDPDQAIYGFRGADVRNFLGFTRDFHGAREIALTRNYRSTRVILNGASALMGKSRPLEGQGKEGDPIRLTACRTASEEAEMIVEQIEKLLGGTTYFSLDSGRVASNEEGENIGFGDIAVLFRLNAQGDVLEEALSRAGIPCVRSGEKPIISRRPVNMIWRFLQALHYPESPHFRQAYLDLAGSEGLKGHEILENCAPGASLQALIEEAVDLHRFDDLNEDGTEALRRLREMAAGFQGTPLTFLDHLSLDRGIDHATLAGDRVALMSLHAAKGLEWPVVFITGCEEGLLPCTLFGGRDEEEDKRLFYVGMTRARSRLILSHAGGRSINGRPLQMPPSSFLTLVPDACCGALERSGWKGRKKAHKQLELF